MKKRKISNGMKKIIWLILVAIFMVSGCRRMQKENISATEPNIERIVLIEDYASDAINATGGMDAWTETEKLALDAIVTFYEPDKSLYLTEHHFEIYPLLNSIEISSNEPLSELMWHLSHGQFSMLKGYKGLDVAPKIVSYRDYAEAVLNIITAPMRLVDESFDYTKARNPVKMKGLWYYPITQIYPANQASVPGSEQMYIAPIEPYWSEVVFFQNSSSSLMDVVWFAMS